jgi:hypothetical protein
LLQRDDKSREIGFPTTSCNHFTNGRALRGVDGKTGQEEARGQATGIIGYDAGRDRSQIYLCGKTAFLQLGITAGGRENGHRRSWKPTGLRVHLIAEEAAR